MRDPVRRRADCHRILPSFCADPPSPAAVTTSESWQFFAIRVPARDFVVARAAPLGGEVDAAWDVTLDLEVGVQTPLDQGAAGLLLEQGGGGQLGQGRQQGGIDECDGVAEVFESGVVTQRLELAAEFGDDLLEAVRIEGADRLGERTERGAWAAEPLLDVLELAGLLQSEGIDAWVTADDAGGELGSLQLEGVRVLVAPADEARALHILANSPS